MFNLGKTYTTWNVERISRHVLYWLAWLLFYTLVNGGYSGGDYWMWMKAELYFMPVKLAFTYFVIYILVPRYLIKKKYTPFLLSLLIGSTIGGLLIRYIDFNYVSIGWQPDQFITIKISYKILDLIYIASLLIIIKMHQYHLRQEQDNQQLIQQKLGAELQLLKNQLHPHFLFNTLNNLYGMVLTKDEKAPQVVLYLSKMMSYMLYECDVDRIALNKELEHLENYIALEQLRYDDRLEISYETAGDFDHKAVAPLLLIAFIENAFKHGPAKEEKRSWINCNVWVKGDELSFKVENSLPTGEIVDSEEQEGKAIQGGIGLQNVRKRLNLLYPERHQLKIVKEDSFLVHLQLKLD